MSYWVDILIRILMRRSTYKNLDGIEVPVQQMGKNGAFVGQMILKLQKN